MHPPLLYTFYVEKKIDTDMSNTIMKYIGGQTHIIFNTHKLPLITILDRKMKCITFKHVEHFCCPDVKYEIFQCKKCAENYNGGLLNKVGKISDTIDDKQVSPLLQSPIANMCSSSICDNDTNSDRKVIQTTTVIVRIPIMAKTK